MYTIVKFVDECDAPGIVCTHWITEDPNVCRYPNVKTNEARDRLLRKRVGPETGWSTCRIQILRRFNSFAAACLRLKQAEETSNLESEDEAVKRPRKRSRAHLTLPGEESEEDSSSGQGTETCPFYPYPVPPFTGESSSSTSLLPQDISSRRDQQSFSSSLLPQHVGPSIGEPGYSQPDNFSFSPSLLPPPIPNIASASPSRQEQQSFSSNINIMNGKLLAWMADISSKVQDNAIKLQELLDNQNKFQKEKMRPELDVSIDDLSCLGNLPVIEDCSFMELNGKLAEDCQLRQLLMKVLISVGGKDTRSHIHNMLRRILTDEVAELYSLTGKSTSKNSSKKPFFCTEVAKLIFSVCHKVYRGLATEVKVKEAMADWLNQAKVRKNRRMQRGDKNEELVHPN